MARKGLRGEALFGERAPLETQTFFLGAANGGFEPMYVPAAVRKSSIARLQEVADMYSAFESACLLPLPCWEYARAAVSLVT